MRLFCRHRTCSFGGCGRCGVLQPFFTTEVPCIAFVTEVSGPHQRSAVLIRRWRHCSSLARSQENGWLVVGLLLACCSHLASKRSMIDMIGRVKDSMWQSYFAKLSCRPLMLLQEQIFLGTWITLITILDECFARHEAWSAGQNLSLSCTILRGDLSKLCRNQITYLRHRHTAARFVFLRRVFSDFSGMCKAKARNTSTLWHWSHDPLDVDSKQIKSFSRTLAKWTGKESWYILVQRDGIHIHDYTCIYNHIYVYVYTYWISII